MTHADQVSAQLLAAAAGESTFDDAVDSIANYFGSGGSIIFELNRKTGQILDWSSPNLVIGGDGYDEHINAINPRMRFSLRHAPGHIVCEEKFINERGIDRSEFYDWLQNFAGFRYMLGSRLYDEGDISVFHSAEFTKHHGHPSDEKIAEYRRIAPSIGHAWKLRKRVSNTQERNKSDMWTPDHLPWAIFALSSGASVINMNTAARDLLEAGQAFELLHGQLSPLARQSVPSFFNAVKVAMSGQSAEALLSAGETGTKLIAQVLPVDPKRRTADVNVAALVYVWDPLKPRENIGHVLGRLYGLTTAEQTLAGVLASGMDLTAASEQLKLSRNTVRNRLQSIYAKTDTHRLNEFLVKVLGVLNRS